MVNKYLLSTTRVSVLTLGMVSMANASILTFDGIVTIDIPDDYGDRITSTSDSTTGFSYGEGNGFTPNITVSYIPGGTISYRLYTSGFGDLSNALSDGDFNTPGEIVLTPDAGHQVVLNSFDIAGWQNTTYLDQQILVLNASDTVLFDSGFIDVNSGLPDSHLTFLSTPIVSSEALRIAVNDFGNLGIDNINFDQMAVPVPAAVWLFGSGLIGLIGVARRKKE